MMVPLVVQPVAYRAPWPPGLTLLATPEVQPQRVLRFVLAAIFGFAGLLRFLPRTRPAFVRMVPPTLHHPELLVSLTGALEFGGALGLLLPPVVRPAALALAGLLIAWFPANVHLAGAGLALGRRRATPLRYRPLMQLFWLACLLWVAARS